MDSVSCRRSTSTNPSVLKVENIVKILRFFFIVLKFYQYFKNVSVFVITFHCCVVLIISNVFKVMTRNRFHAICSTSPLNTDRKLLRFKEQISDIYKLSVD